MKLNFKKIASVLTGAIMLSSTMGFAAAASFPAPFVSNGASDAAIVVTARTHTGAMSDMTAAIDLTQNHLNPLVTTEGSGGSTATGGDSYKFEKTSTKFHLGDNITSVVSSTIDDDELPTLLADGKYVDNDNDEFDYTQKIVLDSGLQLIMFEDNDYKADEPTVGFKIASGSTIFTYTKTFSDEPLINDMTSSNLNLMGKEYYVLSNTSYTTLTLLDSAETIILSEGETGTIAGHSASIEYISATEVKLNIDGELTSSLGELETQKLDDGSYIGIKDIMHDSKEGAISKVEFSLGIGKLKLTTGQDAELNDEAVSGLGVTLTDSTDTKLASIALAWSADDDLFIAEDSEITMPGFETVKMSFGGLTYNSEEVIEVQQGGDTYAVFNDFPLKDGIADIHFLYGDSTNFTGLGKDSDNKLVTDNDGNFTFDKDTDDYFIASWSDGSDAESYLMRATNFVLDGSYNKTDIEYYKDGAWIDKKSGAKTEDTFSVGNADLAIGFINQTGKSVEIWNNSANTNFNTLYSAEGMTFYLPWENSTDVDLGITQYATPALACAALTLAEHSIYTGTVTYNLTANVSTAQTTICQATTWTLETIEEDKSENKYSGDTINLTIGWDSSSTAEVEVSDVVREDVSFVEILETDVWRSFMYSALATELLWDKPSSGQKSVKFVYHGDEVAADVYITSPDAIITPDTPTGGQVLVYKDSEVSSFSDKNLVIVGGSCVNEAAAKLLGSDVPVCGADFTAATSVISGGYIIKVFDSPYNADKIAMLVAGYEASDTVNAIAKLKENTVSTLVGTEVIYPTTSA